MATSISAMAGLSSHYKDHDDQDDQLMSPKWGGFVCLQHTFSKAIEMCYKPLFYLMLSLICIVLSVPVHT